MPSLSNSFMAGETASISAQEYELLSIDYAQGESDMNFVFFFHLPRHKTSLTIKRLTDSLFKTMIQFPVLLGRITAPKESSGGGKWKVVFDPDDPNWPDVSEASANRVTLASIKRTDYAWRRWPRASRVPNLCQRAGNPLFGLHIVRYACGGISLHTKVRHQVMDGCGIWQFYRAWASMCYALSRRPQRKLMAARGDSEVLMHSRSSVLSAIGTVEGSVDQGGMLDELDRFFERVALHRQSSAHAEVPRHMPARMHRFGITYQALHRLKQRHGTMSACSPGHAQLFTTPHKITYVSTNDLLCALFWRAISRAHQAVNPSDPNTCMMLACDVRHRIGLPPTYSGNLSFPLIMHSTKDELDGQKLTDTATCIRHRINGITAGFVHESLALLASEQLMQKLISLFDPANCFFSASITSGFRMFDMSDFGFGQPAHIDIPAYLDPGFSIFMPTRSSKTAVNVCISLRNDVFKHMAADSEFTEFVDMIH
ncbi:hypothetical protein GGI15_004411 [Coemansia interrupta]|uniref:Transferase n=1 Tax=Coemansia interrupta TaxID=1126814 RepID=A0A9W8LFH4_9FUNG|nr:hypothetical protein GGI15_004411 [Coemansia interrupta]